MLRRNYINLRKRYTYDLHKRYITIQPNYVTFQPNLPKKPNNYLIIGLLLAGIGIYYGKSLLFDDVKNTFNYIVTGFSMSGSLIFILRHIRRL
jgi:hypothetical protein